MENLKIIPENIQLFHLNIVKSNITDSLSKNDSSFKVNVAHTTMHNLKDQKIKIGLIIDIESENSDETQKSKAYFNIDFHFQIKELSSFYKLNDKDKPMFSGVLIATLLGISFSTARGLIYERLLNTSLNGLILPIVSPNKILQSRIIPEKQ